MRDDGQHATGESGTTAAGRILLTGATGYIGGRLLRRLEADRHTVRCLARRPDALRPRVGAGTEVVAGDVLDRASLDHALRDVETAYYLVHSMGADRDFETTDRAAAEHFGNAARAAGVRRIIYLGGLGNEAEALSPHLASRHEVGRVLRAARLPVLEFRTSVVIGSGSLSFEMIRALVENLPVMITPRWVDVLTQPIAVDDLLDYLVAALALPTTAYRVYQIGGADVVSYGDMMRIYARQRGLRRPMIPVPVLTPRLSSLWLGLVTPLYARVGRKLIQSIANATVVTDPAARETFAIRPMRVEDAVRRALDAEDARYAATRWSDALSAAGHAASWGGVRFGSRLVDSRAVHVAAPPAAAFRPIQRIGGESGWYAWNALWQLRGFLDLLAGGVGTRRGRPHPECVRVGDTVDFWRVEAFEPDRRLRLAAEMKLPGRAWLEFEVTPASDGITTVRQTASFDPAGIFGRIYWYTLWPVHQLVFGGMIRAIGRAVTTEASAPR